MKERRRGEQREHAEACRNRTREAMGQDEEGSDGRRHEAVVNRIAENLAAEHIQRVQNGSAQSFGVDANALTSTMGNAPK